MDGINMKEVDFNKYCALCVNRDVIEDDDPCFDCLQVPAREGTRQPLKFEEAKTTR